MDSKIIIGIVIVVIIIVFVVMNQEKQITPDTITVDQPAPVPPTTPEIATPTPVQTNPVAPPPTITMLTANVGANNPNAFWGNWDLSVTQDSTKTIDGDLGTLWNPISNAENNPSYPKTYITYTFGSRKHVSKIVIKSGLHTPTISEDWATVRILCNGEPLKTENNNSVKILRVGNESYTRNEITIGQACTSLTLEFNDEYNRVREVEFYGY